MKFPSKSSSLDNRLTTAETALFSTPISIIKDGSITVEGSRVDKEHLEGIDQCFPTRLPNSPRFPPEIME
jgi:hypothetical protein